MEASNQWAKRPADERYVNLEVMRDVAKQIKSECHTETTSIKDLRFEVGENGNVVCFIKGVKEGGKFVKPIRYKASHWAFGQITNKITCPAEFMRRLPAELAVKNLNHCIENGDYGYVDKMQFLLRHNGHHELRAATSEGYGRIWNSDILDHVVKEFGDGINGRFRVPGEFGKRVEVNVDNTTLYMGDRDMFVFLTDEENKIQLPNRRNGQPGELSRGFYFWNSEVGSKTFGVATFYFDYVCANRIIWGAEEVQQFKMKHSKYAPEKFVREVLPGLTMFAEGSSKGILHAIEETRKVKFDTLEVVTEFMIEKLKLGKRVADKVNYVHMLEEDKPIENVWEVITGVTAFARSIDFQCERVELEQKAGDLLKRYA